MMTDCLRALPRFILVSLLFASGLALDAAAAYTPVCNRDVQKYCRDVEPGQGRLTECVMRNQSRFSPLCRADVHVLIERRMPFTRHCKDDAEQYCPGIKAGKGRLYACLKFHEEQLGARCKKQLE